jgi:hypothetical protein
MKKWSPIKGYYALFQVFPLSGKRLFVTVAGENNDTN